MAAAGKDTGRRCILVTGATGYVGGRLVRALECRGRRVRCLARTPAKLAGRVSAATEIVEGDVLDGAALARAMEDAEAAYYLIHSMGSERDFEEEDRRAAALFCEAAARAGVARIIYLGGLGEPAPGLSPHLRSRHEVGAILARSGSCVLELRCSIVIGCGSLSFEMVRALVERLPAMVTPRWVDVPTQPIATDDLLSFLVEALAVPVTGHRIVEIGGPDRVSYGALMREYAHQRKLRRLMIPVPVLTPRLSSLWLGLVTPYYARVGRKLIDSLRNATVVRDAESARAFSVRPVGVREAIARALAEEDEVLTATRSSELVARPDAERTWYGVRVGSRILDSREAPSALPPHAAFRAIERIGGAAGWYCCTWLWRLRGLLDSLCGGVGMRRGRRDSEHLESGDPVDFWRVAEIEPSRRLRLAAEMKLPGRAWLEFEVYPDRSGSRVLQTAIYAPRGLLGLLYWWALYPVHGLVFGGMLRAIASRGAAANPDPGGITPR